MPDLFELVAEPVPEAGVGCALRSLAHVPRDSAGLGLVVLQQLLGPFDDLLEFALRLVELCGGGGELAVGLLQPAVRRVDLRLGVLEGGAGEDLPLSRNAGSAAAWL